MRLGRPISAEGHGDERAQLGAELLHLERAPGAGVQGERPPLVGLLRLVLRRQTNAAGVPRPRLHAPGGEPRSARAACCILAAELDWKSEGVGSKREEPSCFRPLQRARDTGFEPVAFGSGVPLTSTPSTKLGLRARRPDRLDVLNGPGRFGVGP